MNAKCSRIRNQRLNRQRRLLAAVAGLLSASRREVVRPNIDLVRDSVPTSSDWYTAANWSPMSIPNGPTSVATFGTSTIPYANA